MAQRYNDDPGWEPRRSRDDITLQDTQPTPLPPIGYPPRPPSPVSPRRRKRRRLPAGCISLLLAGVILAAIYFLLPLRTNLLILGTDSREADNPLGRTDTIILTTIVPLQPEIGMLSVPRDLWVPIEGFGENRINTAYFFAEAAQPGTGTEAALRTVNTQFKVDMDYYVLVKFNGIVDVVDAMGGIDIDFPRAMSGYDEGVQHLDGTQALALVRDRAGSDDFFRMERGQLFIRSMIQAFANPLIWPRLPFIVAALPAALETDLPAWQWPRIALALLRAGPDGIDGRALDRDMAVPFTTADGASVLLPNWALIDPVVEELFE